MAGNRFVYQEPLLGKLNLHFVLRKHVLFDADVHLGGGVAGMGRDLPHAQVGLAGQGQFHGSHAELIGGDGLLEDLDGLGVLNLDGGLGGYRLQFRVQGHEAHKDRLARFVDGLVCLQEKEGALLHLDLGVVREARAADDDLVVALGELWDLELDGALAFDQGRGFEDGLAILAEGHLHVPGGQALAAEQRQRHGLHLAGAEDAGNEDDVAVHVGCGGGATARGKRGQQGQDQDGPEQFSVTHSSPPVR